MEFLSLETNGEQVYFLNICDNNKNAMEPRIQIGGITEAPGSLSEWYWVETGRKIDFSLKFAPGEPGNVGERCLGVINYSSKFMIMDLACYEIAERPFMCQTREFL